MTKTEAELVEAPTGGMVIAPAEAPQGDAPDLSLVIPTCNGRAHLEALLEHLVAVLARRLEDRFEIIVVDDDSPDETGRIALAFSQRDPRVRVVRHRFEGGLAAAVVRGWQVARGAVLGVIEGDVRHPPEKIAALWDRIAAGAQLAVASRYADGGGIRGRRLSRRVLSRGARLLGLAVLPEVAGRVSDPLSGFFLVRRSAICEVRLRPTGDRILLEVLARGRRRIERIAEVGYVFEEGSKKTRGTPLGGLRFIRHLIILRVSLFLGSRFIRFCIVGGSGVLVDMFVLFLLSDPIMLGWGLTRSKILAAELAIFNNFLWNDAWTFSDLTDDRRTLHHKLHRFWKFNAVCFLGLVMNVVILNIAFNVFELNRYLSNGIAILLVTLWNFWINLKFSWRSSRT